MSKDNTMPFEAEPATPKALNPVEAAYRDAMEQYARERDAHKANAIAEAWEEYEAERKGKYIRSWLRDYYTPLKNPYKDKTPAEVYRMTRPYETRLDELIKVGLWSEALKVWIYRRKCHATIEEIQEFLRGVGFPADGKAKIESYDTSLNVSDIHAKGISPELRDLIHDCGFEVRRGDVYWIVGEREIEPATFSSHGKYRSVLACGDQDNYSRREY
ncbi:MAG TPA: hypothetical protein VKX49_13105 [Bryobacteraceae bacterium]|nr:hypothetical protein [Bryobacteraceae bacterium]